MVKDRLQGPLLRGSTSKAQLPPVFERSRPTDGDSSLLTIRGPRKEKRSCLSITEHRHACYFDKIPRREADVLYILPPRPGTYTMMEVACYLGSSDTHSARAFTRISQHCVLWRRCVSLGARLGRQRLPLYTMCKALRLEWRLLLSQHFNPCSLRSVHIVCLGSAVRIISSHLFQVVGVICGLTCCVDIDDTALSGTQRGH